MKAWLNPLNWRRLLRRNQYRDALAILFWRELDRIDAARDDDETFKRVCRVVAAVESRSEADLPATDVQLLHAVRQAPLGERALQGLPALASKNPGAATVLSLSQKERRQLRAGVSSGRNARNLNLLSHLPVLVPLFSAFLLFSGFVFNALLFNRFGFGLQPYFGLSDYLSASITNVLPVLGSLALTMLMSMFMSSWQYVSVLRLRLGTAMPAQVTGLAVMAGAYFALPLLQGHVREMAPQAVEIMRTYLLLVGVVSFLAGPMAAHSRRPIAVYVVLMFLGVYAAVIWFIAVSQHHGLTQTSKLPRTLIHFSDSSQEPKRWRIVTGNSLYLFAMDETCLLQAIPLDAIARVQQLPALPEPEDTEEEANGKAVNNQQDKPWCTPIVSPAKAVAPAPPENPKTAVPIAK